MWERFYCCWVGSKVVIYIGRPMGRIGMVGFKFGIWSRGVREGVLCFVVDDC